METECTEVELLTYVNSFLLKFSSEIPLFFKKEKLKTIRVNPSFMNSLSNQCGIYYFIQDANVLYIGSASEEVGLRNRLFSQINSSSDPAWDEMISGRNVEIGVIVFNKFQCHQICALKHFLFAEMSRPN